jgi:hypothetical protein
MSWKKYFTPVNTDGSSSPVGSMSNRANPSRANYSSFLPDVYSGHPNRQERYSQYNTMDSDSEVNAALDILAEFCTQINDTNRTPFEFFFRDTATQAEILVLRKYLQQWCKMNKFTNRIFKIVRNAFKFGDVFFVRDPETQEWMYIDPSKVDKIIVNESSGKLPEQYVIRDLNINLQNLTVTQINPSNTSGTPGGTNYMTAGTQQRGMAGSIPGNVGTRFQLNQNQYAIDAKHVIHLSMSEGLDDNFPFGNSLLESIFKVYKQKELLEDAIIIYRVQRAPERRVFYIDVGNMPSHLAMSFVERVKNEVNQRRIPSLTGGGTSVIDTSYNPLAIGDDFFFPQTAEGRGSKVEILPGGCFAMDTKVSLLDGREMSIQEISEEMKNGKELWTYSCEPLTGKIVPGLITWAGVTHESAKVMKITLDNGEHIICTPCHKFPQYDQEFKRAGDFKVGDSMIPLRRRNNIINENTKDYEQYFDNASKEWIYTHRMVANYLKDTVVPYWINDESISNGEYEVRHHKNFNRFDNDPSNLVWMSWKDHMSYHQTFMKFKYDTLKESNPEEYARICNKMSTSLKAKWNSLTDDEREYRRGLVVNQWKNHTVEEYNDRCSKIRDGLTNYISNMSEEDRKTRAQNSRESFVIAGKKFNEKMSSDTEFYDHVMSKRMQYWTEENRKKRSDNIRECNYVNWNSEHGQERRKKHSASQQMQFTHDMLKFVINQVKGKTTHEVTAENVADALNESPYRDELISLNSGKTIRNWKPSDGFTEGNIRRGLVRQFGYKNWKDFRVKESLHNHTVVSIEYLDEPIQVGTLTIDGNELHHNYHTFALSVGIMVFNSNLGEIDDLRYFTNKLFRALRIPSSYLPTGPDDGGSAFNDGRVGTAYIQELRFNKYCQRLQGILNEHFDNEFKLYLFNKGVNVDPNIFDIKFNPPQNFASYRQAEMDTVRVSTFASMSEVAFISKRFALKRFLGMSEEEVAENQKLWREENLENIHQGLGASAEMRSAGITAGGAAMDLGAIDNAGIPPEGMTDGDTGAAPPAPGAAPTPGATSAPPPM